MYYKGLTKEEIQILATGTGTYSIMTFNQLLKDRRIKIRGEYFDVTHYGQMALKICPQV